MKKYLLISIFVVFEFFFSRDVMAQYVTIPDANFVTFLQTNFPGCMNGNQMDTTCSNITGASSINCSNKNIGDLYGINFFDNLQTLNCTNNNLTALNELPSALLELYCVNNDLSSIQSLPNNLTILDCTNNLLTSLPTLPFSLTSLTANSNDLTSLPNLPNNLITLNANVNQINSLPVLPALLINLFISDNQLTSLQPLPTNLVRLSCGKNQISSLPTLPNTLNLLQCGTNPLNTLPPLPILLETLDVAYCNLISLPVLPPDLLSLSFGNPGFSITPVLPNNLIQLGIYKSDLTTFPAFPNTLTFLDLRENDLAMNLLSVPPQLNLFSVINNDLILSIPAIPNSVKLLYITNSNVTTIPEFPDSLNYCYLDNNPLLQCLPELKQITYFSWQNTGITCLPNYGNITNSTPLLSSVPLCDLFNSNSCDFYYNISGKVYADNNQNCIDEPGEAILSGLKINVFQSGNLIQQGFTSQTGFYTLDTQLGTYDYTPDTTDVPYFVSCPPSGIQTSVLTMTDSTDTGMDFGLQCKPGFDVGVVAVVNTSVRFFPGDSSLVIVKAGDFSTFYNLHCSSGIAGTLTVTFTGPVAYLSPAVGSLTPTVGSNFIEYTITDFGAINLNTAFAFYLLTDTAAQAGQSICLSVDVTPTFGDNNPSNNNLTHCFQVVTSYDPNEKSVSPVGDIEQNQEWLTYTIHFQNTGNAPAQHIVVTDTLDASIQEATFTYLGSSHEPFIQVNGNVVKFSFPNINLPDSTNDEPNSHGYVQYKVKIDSGLTVGTTIENTANIFFDFNTPVITNTTVNTIVAPTGVTELNSEILTVYPIRLAIN